MFQTYTGTTHWETDSVARTTQKRPGCDTCCDAAKIEKP